MGSPNRFSSPLCFNPETNPLFQKLNFDLDQPPRYLFRTFDPLSSGYTDDLITKSPAAVRSLPHHTQDILSLEPNFAQEVLEKHMNPWRRKNKPPEPEPNIDNFTSWATSLLYVVQYAYHRRRLYGCSEDQIKIIAVDTSLFPPRTFIRASALLQAHFDLVKKDDMRHTIGVRLLAYIYKFGEYLCQGTLVHHRYCEEVNGPTSHVISLAALRQNGLAVLYPELDDPTGHEKWALRTVSLRRIWHGDEYGKVPRQRSTRGELQAAASLASKWFRHPFDPAQLAVCLLSFKRRQLSVNEANADGNITGVAEEWMRHPVDVREFVLAAQVVKYAEQNMRIDSPLEQDESDRGDYTFGSERVVERCVLQRLLSCYSWEC